MAEVDYFYSAHSAYAYLGSAYFMDIAKASGWTIVHKPIDLNRAMASFGSTPFRERSVKQRDYFFRREMERWAEFRGVIMPGRPSNHHHSPDLANRMLIAAKQAGETVDALAHRMLEAHWGEGADLADGDVLVGIAGDVDMDGPRWLEAAGSPEAAREYAANTDEAIARNVPGSPTYFVDGDMFYGQDHLELVARAMARPFKNTWPEITA
jgi:2-hydroxychromene-2-carboxylate isomerase